MGKVKVLPQTESQIDIHIDRQTDRQSHQQTGQKVDTPEFHFRVIKIITTAQICIKCEMKRQ